MSLFAFALNASAQSRIGVIGGLNFSTMKPAADEEIVGRTVMGFGGVFSIGMSEHVRLKIEPMFIQKFAGIEATSIQPALDTELTGIEVPVLLKIGFGRALQPYIVAGPSFGYLLKSEVKTSTGGFDAVADLKNILKRVGVGLSIGGGFDVPAGPLLVFLECRYTWELLNLNKGGEAEFIMGSLVIPFEIDENDDMKSRGLQVMAGVLIPI